MSDVIVISSVSAHGFDVRDVHVTKHVTTNDTGTSRWVWVQVGDTTLASLFVDTDAQLQDLYERLGGQ